jgi:hypothetical protein
MPQDGEAAGDQAAEVGASFISGRLAALEVAEGQEAVPEPLDAAAAAAVRAQLQAGLLAHAQGAEHAFCAVEQEVQGGNRRRHGIWVPAKVQSSDPVLSIKKCRKMLDHLPNTCMALEYHLDFWTPPQASRTVWATWRRARRPGPAARR